ncbi:hypothetical protein RF11_10975 [Thelohanellus kitauei]|uniref:Uncharacterized protein n=1 Tax=Thelohanellus kitauei TaxID=669202 RepID=A0A0C2IRY4_THEKT|nr:hypothetical protein RF11_10975 [Thelohanellus kitauei]
MSNPHKVVCDYKDGTSGCFLYYFVFSQEIRLLYKHSVKLFAFVGRCTAHNVLPQSAIFITQRQENHALLHPADHSKCNVKSESSCSRTYDSSSLTQRSPTRPLGYVTLLQNIIYPYTVLKNQYPYCSDFNCW